MFQLHPQVMNQLYQSRRNALNPVNPMGVQPTNQTLQMNAQPKITNYAASRNSGYFVNEGDPAQKLPQGTVNAPAPSATVPPAPSATVPTAPPAPSTPTSPTPPVATTAPPVPNSTPPATAPQATPFDESAYKQGAMNESKTYLDNIYNAQRDAQLAQLKASRDKAIGQINLQDAQLAPQYADKRNQADVVNNQNVQRLRELMASNGLRSSGENISANVGLQSARQSALNTLNTQEQQQHNDFAQRIADLNDPAQEQALIAALETERSKSMYDAYNRAGDQAYQRGRDNTMDNRYNAETAYNHGRDAIGDQRYTDETTYNHGRDASNDAWRQGQFDYQKGRDAIGDQRYNSETTYAHGRDAIGDQRYNSETTYSHGQDAVKNAQWESEQKYNRGQDALNRADRNKQQAVDNAWKQKAWSQMSPAEQQKAALDLKNSQALVNSRAAVKSSGGSRTVGTGKGNTPKPVKQKSASASYNEGLSYWTGKQDDIRKQGAYRVEQALRNDPAQIKALTAQGYDVNSVVDALYSAASGGQFKSKADYQKYVTSLNKQAKNNLH